MKCLYLLLGLFSVFTLAQENFVQINGKTNVNKFHCINNKFQAETRVYNFTDNHLPNIILKVDDFDCGNRMMNNDFKKILMADKYPEMTIKFISFAQTQNSYIATVEVKMMTQSKRYKVAFNLENNKLVGRKNVKFSDFHITPPQKMGGMIVVQDDLDLIFSLATKM